MTKAEYEGIKSSYLFDKRIYNEIYKTVLIPAEYATFSNPNEKALDVLNDLVAAGAINVYEYYTQKERHMLY